LAIGIRRILPRLQSPLALTFILFAPLVLLRVILVATGHVPMGHDTFQYLQLQYTVFNEVAINGHLPQWFPFMTHGTVSNFWIQSSSGILFSLLVPFAPLLKGVNFLYIFEAGFLFDEFILLLGCVLLARRHLKSLPAVIFVSAAITYTAASSVQIWYDFHFFYLIPLILYSLDRAVIDASARHLFLAGLLGLAMFLGNLSYFAPVITFSIVIFGLAMVIFAPRESLETVKRFWLRRSWRHLVAVLVVGGLAGVIAAFIWGGFAEVVMENIGRGQTGAVGSISEFLTYGGYIGLGKYMELISRYSNNNDTTIYATLLVVPFALVTLWRVRSRAAYGYGITALVLALFSAGTLVAVGFYYLFPLGNYFRHIGHVAPLAKMFLVFYAGFGFREFWVVLRDRQQVRWRDRSRQDRFTLLIPAVAMALIVGAVAIERFQWYPIFNFPGWFAPTENQLYLTREAISSGMTWLLLLSGGLLLLLLAVFRFPKQAMVLMCLLLAVHIADGLSHKVELEYRRVPQVSAAVIDLFKSEEYTFSMERSQDYYANARFVTLAPYLVGESGLVGGGKAPHTTIGRFGALYWNTESFLYFDAAASTFRTDHWLRSIEEFYGAFVKPIERLPRHLGFPIPESLTYWKLIGYEFPKLQVFTRIHSLPTDEDVTALIASPEFSGDFLLCSAGDVASVPADGVVSSGAGLPDSSERLESATLSVEEFTFDTLRLRVDTGHQAPSVLYYADAWHPEWHAFVNGQPAPVIRTNLGYKSVILPPGESEVLFSFGSSYSYLFLYSIIFLGILASGGVLYLAAVDLRKSKWSE